MADDLDVSTYVDDGTGVLDLDPQFRWISGRRARAEALLRRLEIDPGSLPYDTDAGLGIRSWLSKGLTQLEIFQLGALIEAEAVKDERIASASASLVYEASARKLTITLLLVDSDGPFKLVLAIDAVSASILSLAT